LREIVVDAELDETLRFSGPMINNGKGKRGGQAGDRHTTGGRSSVEPEADRPHEGPGMPEVIITLDGHHEELAVFGSRDQYLRQVRDALGVKVLARHGEVRVDGDRERVEQARHIFEGLRALYRRQKSISSSDVADQIEQTLRASEPERTDLLEIREGGRTVRARTEGQARYLRALRDNELVLAIGPAGTGKTYLAVATAVSALRRGRIKKIVLCRPAVEAGEKLGFLPGDLEAKINPYLRPLLDALHDLMDYDQIRRYTESDLIEIAPLAYMRGRTLNDAVIILDEGQNTTVPQMKMFLTRMGMNARIVVTGDVTQVDLPPGTVSGLADAVERLKGVPGLGVVTLDKSDIIRHPLVQAIVNAYEADGSEPAATGAGDAETAAAATTTAADAPAQAAAAEKAKAKARPAAAGPTAPE
jgi:phosphate starvation-inducible PhoH-like protein